MLNRSLSPIRGTAAFYATAIAISWSCWLPVAAVDHGLLSLPSGLAETLVIVGGFGPLFAALAMMARNSGPRGIPALLGHILRWRVSVRWYVAALVLPAAFRFAVLGMHVANHGTVPGIGDLGHWLALPLTFVFVLLLGGPLGEELGWRGFMQPRLQTAMGMLPASVVIGVASALWHLPLFLIPSTAQSHLPLVLFVIRTVALSIILGWLWNRSNRSLLVILLFHASLNTWPNTVFILEEQGALGPYLTTTILYVGWACLLWIFGQLSDRWSVLKPRQRTAEAAA
ncbi:MAG: CPBP family intramembrane metalloprotease [Candidatus Dormibacteraeota bacterium]|nr:CPBP family intramembrane metalloprotease [Candidatus Dormibacteraeota bacterium]